MTIWDDTKAFLEQHEADAVAAAVAPVQAELDTANEGIADRDNIITGLQARVTDLQAQLDACQNPTPTPDRGLLVGARGRETDTVSLQQSYNDAVAKLGPLQVTRVFEQPLPATHVPFTPDGVVEIVSFTSATDANIKSFVASARPGTLFCYRHECEKPTLFADGAAWKTAYHAMQAKFHALGAQLGIISAGYQYRSGQRAYDGSFIVADADWYAIDTYRDGSTEASFGAIVPLTDVAEFQRWYGFVKDLGCPLGVTEYGRGTTGATDGQLASAADKRATVLPMDVQYLQGLGFFCLSYWYSNVGPDGRSWAFNDKLSLDNFRALARG